ncbi:MAG: hypothetical protein V4463_19450 [Pseudomonadota bacterium]
MNQKHNANDAIDYPPLQTEARRTMAFPLARERLIMNALDRVQAKWTRNARDILPFFKAFEYLDRHRTF